MSPKTSRTAFGLAAICLGLGFSFTTTPAWAASMEGTSATYSYTCEDQDGGATEGMDIEVYVAAPTEAQVGQETEFQVEPSDYNFYSYTDGGEITSGTLSADAMLGGDAAPSTSATAETEAEGGFGTDNEETFDETDVLGTFTPETPGEITLAPGDITVDVEQSAGDSSTVCSPDSTTDELATVAVEGEPIDTETDDGAEDAGDEEAADEPATGAEEDSSMQPMLIVGAVLGGLLVIGGIVMVGLLVFFMRRS